MTDDNNNNGTTATKTFPVESKVILHSLKAEQYNGKEAIVKSSLGENGRQEVLLGKKLLNIRPCNLKYQTKPIASLSLKELKSILKEKEEENENVNFAGMDASDLRRQVSEMETEDAFHALALANEKAYRQKEAEKEAAAQANSSKAKQQQQHHDNNNKKKLNDQADQLANMSPEQLRQQARAMKSIPPDQIRRMNPEFRHMSDAQILQAANQMEQMADNPELLRQAANQMKHMSPEQVQRATTGGGAAAAGTPPQPQSMENVTPEQLLQQAQLMRGMSKDQIRSMNPQMADFSDAEIEQSIQQMEVMATNPAMFEMAKNQMKDMTPEQMAELQQQARGMGGQGGATAGQGGGAAPPPGGGAAGMKLSDMSGKDLKKMLDMVEKNPAMLKHMLPPGTDEEQFQKGFGMFKGMSEEQLDSTLKMMQTADQYTAPIRNAYSKTNAMCGGHLLKVLVLLTIGMMYGVAYWYLAPSSVSSSAPGATVSSAERAVVDEEPIPHFEEDSEF